MKHVIIFTIESYSKFFLVKVHKSQSSQVSGKNATPPGLSVTLVKTIQLTDKCNHTKIAN